MKTITQKLWIFSVLLCASINASAYDFEVDGICYDVTNTAKFTCGVSGILEQKCGKNVTIPEHVSYLGKDLTVTEILDAAFKETSIENISLPSTCVRIGNGAFRACTKLPAIDIPQSVTQIGYGAFAKCDNLKFVNITDLKKWCRIDFDEITSNPLSINKAQLLLNGELVSKVSFDNSITKIGAYAFAGYAYLAEVDLTDNIQSIGMYAFYGCSNLKKLRIGQGLAEIPKHAFAKCPNLTDLHIADSDSELEFYGNYIETDKSGNMHYAGDFSDSNLKEVYIGRNLKQSQHYSSHAIFEQQDITSVTIGPKVNLITESYFNGDRYEYDSNDIDGHSYQYRPLYGVKNIKKLTILPSKTPLDCKIMCKSGSPYGVSSPFYLINPNTLILGRTLNKTYSRFEDPYYKYFYTFFNKCTDLNYLEVGENVNTISDCLYFDKLNNLSNITVKSSTPPSSGGFSKNTYLHSLLKVPKESLNAYKSARVWKNFWNIEGCDFSGIENIDNGNSLTSVTTENGDIKILNKDDKNIVRVYSIQGMIIAETSENVVHNLPKGLYIVTVGTKSFKVLLK